jgi:hypothetical protein
VLKDNGVPPLSFSTAISCGTRWRSWICCGATFNDSRHCGGKRSMSWHAWASSDIVSGPISPLDSASGMNLSGDNKPRSGWRQRHSSSSDITCRRCRLTIGW